MYIDTSSINSAYWHWDPVSTSWKDPNSDIDLYNYWESPLSNRYVSSYATLSERFSSQKRKRVTEEELIEKFNASNLDDLI